MSSGCVVATFFGVTVFVQANQPRGSQRSIIVEFECGIPFFVGHFLGVAGVFRGVSRGHSGQMQDINCVHAEVNTGCIKHYIHGEVPTKNLRN